MKSKIFTILSSASLLLIGFFLTTATKAQQVLYGPPDSIQALYGVAPTKPMIFLSFAKYLVIPAVFVFVIILGIRVQMKRKRAKK